MENFKMYWSNYQRRRDRGTPPTYTAALDNYPLFIKAGAIIPLDVKTTVTGHGDTAAAGKSTVLVYLRGKSSFTFHRPLGEGTTYRQRPSSRPARVGLQLCRRRQHGITCARVLADARAGFDRLRSSRATLRGDTRGGRQRLPRPVILR